MAAHWAYLDAPTGVAGDMLLAALFDQGLGQEVVLAPLAALGLGEAFRLHVAEGRNGGLRGTKGVSLTSNGQSLLTDARANS